MKAVTRSCLTIGVLALSACGGGERSTPTPEPAASLAFSSASTVEVQEEVRTSFYRAQVANDPSGPARFFVAGGRDSRFFMITENGDLSFVSAPVAAAPEDADGDNVYEVDIAARAGQATATHALKIHVNARPIAERQTQAWVQEGEAGFDPRDSAAGLVHDGRLWVLGGWQSSFQPALRDVWSSAEGKVWQRATVEAPWTHGDFPMAIEFGGRMWIMGGYDLGRLDGATASNQVWSSLDGQTWVDEGHAPWTPRLGAALVSFNGQMWLMGGVERYFDGNEQSLKNDVWMSPDGRSWTLVSSGAPWAPRAFHNAVVFRDRIYLLGGGNYSPNLKEFNDVWSSADGLNWRRETPSAKWAPRIWAGSVVYRDRIWLFGGYSRPLVNGVPGSADQGVNLNDAWTSEDGLTWTRMNFPQIWGERHAMSTFVFNDRIWVTAGFDGNGLKRDVWSFYLAQ